MLNSPYFDNPDYAASDLYQPGFASEFIAVSIVIAAAVLVFVGAVAGARYLSLSSRRLSPKTRRILGVIGNIGRPVSSAHKRRRRHSPRAQPERRERKDNSPIKIALKADPVESTVRHSLPRTGGSTALLPEEAWPFYSKDEIDAVAEVLRSGKVNQWTGHRVFAFEESYSAYLGGRYAIALANGSVALELALRAFGIGPGDEVIVTPRSFVASASCVRLVGATPVFADVDRESGNLTAATVSEAITPRTKAVIPVHLAGWPAEMEEICAIAHERGIVVIEDCAQAHGGFIEGRPLGSFGDAACFSFCQDKIVSTAGEGGLVAFRDKAAFEWAWSFKDHGKNRERVLTSPTAPGFRWLHDAVGTNWRMTEVSAAVGLLQLEKLPSWHTARTANAMIWASELRDIPGLRLPQPADSFEHAYYKFYAYLDVPGEAELYRDQILARAAAAEIRIFSGSCSEIYREGAFRDLEVPTLPVARHLGQSSLMFEVHPTLDERRLHRRARVVREIITDALR